MLTASEIIKNIENGSIVIDPFNIQNVNPNSYDVTLGNKIIMYKSDGYDWFFPSKCEAEDEKLLKEKELQKKPILKANYQEKEIGPDGMILFPEYAYLASTVERTYTPKHVPQLVGKSSLARKFIQIHMTAGFGDIGFNGQWTLEIVVKFPVRVFAGMKIGQISFIEPVGDLDVQYNGNYQDQVGPTVSRM